MCVAYPGKILTVDGRTAKVDFAGNIVSVHTGLVDAKPGDYVLVHAGMAIEAMSKDKAREILEIFEGIDVS
ncbi:hydrogenase [Clostridia bacterium]|nr:hydrogenase [Clostridia bacterium]